MSAAPGVTSPGAAAPGITSPGLRRGRDIVHIVTQLTCANCGKVKPAGDRATRQGCWSRLTTHNLSAQSEEFRNEVAKSDHCDPTVASAVVGYVTMQSGASKPSL